MQFGGNHWRGGAIGRGRGSFGQRGGHRGAFQNTPQSGGGFGAAAAKTNTTAFVGGIPFDADESELREFFGELSMKVVRMGRDKMTGEFRGFAFIEFSDVENLQAAVSYNGLQLRVGTRPMTVVVAKPQGEETISGEFRGKGRGGFARGTSRGGAGFSRGRGASFGGMAGAHVDQEPTSKFGGEGERLAATNWNAVGPEESSFPDKATLRKALEVVTSCLCQDFSAECDCSCTCCRKWMASNELRKRSTDLDAQPPNKRIFATQPTEHRFAPIHLQHESHLQPGPRAVTPLSMHQPVHNHGTPLKPPQAFSQVRAPSAGGQTTWGLTSQQTPQQASHVPQQAPQEPPRTWPTIDGFQAEWTGLDHIPIVPGIRPRPPAVLFNTIKKEENLPPLPTTGPCTPPPLPMEQPLTDGSSDSARNTTGVEGASKTRAPATPGNVKPTRRPTASSTAKK